MRASLYAIVVRVRHSPWEGTMIALKRRGQRAVVSGVDGGIESYTVDGVQALCQCVARSEDRRDGRILSSAMTSDELSGDSESPLTWECIDHVESRAELKSSAAESSTLVRHLSYGLEPGGLVAVCHTTNCGTAPVTYAPELRASLTVGGRIEEAHLQAPARAYARADQVEAAWLPIDQAPLNPRVAGRIGSAQLEVVYSALERDYAGRAYITLFQPGACHVTLWFGHPYAHVAVSTPRRRPEAGCEHLSVRVMTARSYKDTNNRVALPPGANHLTQWGLTVYHP